ncbi:putative dehydrogenase [Georgenia soli]|uniref:Putative dehydrogenase n=1 Tax=Georgenia soli TaxID=638953 RepID=A0A2A9EK78_9MICO|nr:Gfo/Idh/MocA family oxidoreductase [Georgenia soli]PFG38629.1 putative dehydrogenase [Georgenia soli]
MTDRTSSPTGSAPLPRSAPLRVSLLSGVRHAADYLRVLGADPRVELVVVAEEPDAPGWVRADSRRVAERAGAGYTEDVPGALDPTVTDLVVVCSEPTRHARLAVQALEAGVDVLVDKPVATSLADAEAVLAAAARTGRVCAVVNRTHTPALRRARGWIDAGHVGLPLHLDLEFFASGAHFATSVERPQLVVDTALSGGGEIMNFLGYCADAAHYLTGLRTREVHAMAGALFSPAHSDAGVEDTAVVTLGLERGVTATVTLGRVPHAPGGTPTTSSVRVLGSHGHAVADDDVPAVSRFDGSGRATLAADAGQVAVSAYVGHVVDALLTGAQPDYTVAHARDAMAVIDAAYRSLATGDVVTLP